MTTNVTEIINAISQALGIVYDKAVDLYPSVVKMNIVDNVLFLFAGIICYIIAYYILCRTYQNWVKKREKENKNPDYTTYSYYCEEYIPIVIVGFVCLGLGTFSVFHFGGNLIKWIIIPDIMSIQWVVNLIN